MPYNKHNIYTVKLDSIQFCTFKNTKIKISLTRKWLIYLFYIKALELFFHIITSYVFAFVSIFI